MDLSDPLRILEVLFLGGEGLTCEDAADSQDDGRLDLSDALHLLGYQFLGSPPPPGPFCLCGFDPTPDGLGCASFGPCAGLPAPRYRQAWAARYTTRSSDEGHAAGLAIDADGNVFVAGTSNDEAGGDFLTVKYDSNGRQVWTAIYNGEWYGDDQAMAVAVDPAGNVLVAGTSSAGRDQGDFATVKYDSHGRELWVARYQGHLMNTDHARAMAIDRAGNAHVTGSSLGRRGEWDWATVKYDSSGLELWVARHDRGGRDEATAIALDGDGGVHVTGFSQGRNSLDYSTVKYDREGRQLWEARYDGPGGFADRAAAIAVDAAGNTYVTGRSYGQGGDANDFATVKYDPEGRLLWVGRQASNDEGAAALSLDGAGNVLVAGSARGFLNRFEAITIKYDPDGKHLWMATYRSTDTDFRNHPVGLAVDSAGNAVLTGFFYSLGAPSKQFTVKYDRSGTELWASAPLEPDSGEERPIAVAVDGAGNVVVAGSLNAPGKRSDLSTVKYAPHGERLWTSYLDRPDALDSNDRMAAVAVDAGGNVYAAGVSSDWGSREQLLAAKYDPQGREVWARRHDVASEAYAMEVAQTIVLDGAGNIYISAQCFYRDYAVVKLDPGGNMIWAHRLGRSWSDMVEPSALALDPAGNLQVMCSAEESREFKYLTVKLDPDGKEIWSATHGEGYSTAQAMALGDDGSVHLTGRSDTAGEFEVVTVKYDPQGRELWAARFRDPIGDGVFPSAIALGRDGRVHVTGQSAWSFLTIQYSPDGAELWVARYKGPEDQSGDPSAMAVDREGNVHVTGWISGGGSSYAMVKYAPDGRQLWAAIHDGAGGWYDRPLALALDPHGNVHLTGESYTRTGGSNILTIGYDPQGKEIWQACFDGGMAGFGGTAALAVDAAGSIHVAGRAQFPGAGTPDAVTIKYVRASE